MRTIGRGTIFAIVLTTASMALVNAQTPTPQPTSAGAQATQEQLQQLQDQQQRQARQIVGVRNSIHDLKAAQTGQESDIHSLNGRTDALETDAAKAKSDAQALDNSVKHLNDSSGATNASLLSTRKWIAAIGFLVLLCCLGIFFLSRTFIKKLRARATREDIQEMIVAEAPRLIKQVIVRETVYVNSSLPELRNAWVKLRQEIPADGDGLSYAQKYEKNLSKGYDLEGVVEGYKVFFDDNRPIENQTPKFFYDGRRVPYDELSRHGLKILRERQSVTNVVPMTGPATADTLLAAVQGTEIHQTMTS